MATADKKKKTAKKAVIKNKENKAASKKTLKTAQVKEKTAKKVADTKASKKPAPKKKKKKKTKAEQIIQKIGNNANRSLSKYLQEISRFEPLSPEREVDLAIRVKLGDRRALKELTEANLRFVGSVA